MTLKQWNFTESNKRYPAVYISIDDSSVTYRLTDETKWTFSLREARELGTPRIAFLEAA